RPSTPRVGVSGVPGEYTGARSRSPPYTHRAGSVGRAAHPTAEGRTMIINRRAFLAAGTTIATSSAADGQPSQRYPDPLVKVIDPSFAKYRVNLAKVERIATGMRWAEGPVWFGDGRFLLWSDIPNNRIMKWDEETGAVSVFRKPADNANG